MTLLFALQLGVLAILLLLSGLTSMTETSMMAVNRVRLRHRASQGHRGANLAIKVLGQTDRMLSLILIGNNLINIFAAMFVSVITLQLFGEARWVLGISTLLMTFAILVFSEITPKIIGATYADRLAPWMAYILWPAMSLASFVITFVNFFAHGLLRLIRIDPDLEKDASQFSLEELRSLVLESRHAIAPQRQRMLLNLFDMERISVDEVMIPRQWIDALDINAPMSEIREQIATSLHKGMPVFEGEEGNIIGMLFVRQVAFSMRKRDISREEIRQSLVPPYFIPSGVNILPQLQYFRENRQNTGLVVDEYGEILGLVTIENLIEVIVGKFTTTMGYRSALQWSADGTIVVDGGQNLRELSHDLQLPLSVDGPKTLSGLVVNHLQDIPEIGVSLRINGVVMEIMQTENRRVKTVKIRRPAVPESSPDGWLGH